MSSPAAAVENEAGVFADKKLQAIAEDAEISKDMVEWWKAQRGTTIAKVAIVCTEEKEVRGTIIDAMNATKPDMCKILGDQAAAKMFWHLCREEWAKTIASEEVTAASENMVIPARDAESMVTRWGKLHGYVLPDCHMLVPSQTAKVWSGFDRENRELEHWYACKLRHRGEGKPAKVGHQFSVVPGRQLEATEVVLDLVESKIELWMRIRALLMTMAYTSTADTLWFPLQLAVTTSEKMLSLITATFDKQVPPVAFMITAWDSTVHSWGESIRMSKRSAADVIGNVNMWEGKFAWNPNTAGSGQSSNRQSESAVVEADNKRLVNELNSVKGQLAQMQRQAATGGGQERRRRSRSRNNGNGGNGNGGNGGNGGKANNGGGGKGRAPWKGGGKTQLRAGGQVQLPQRRGRR